MHGTLPIFYIHTRVRLGVVHAVSQHLHHLSAKIRNLYHQSLGLTLKFTQCSNVLICFFPSGLLAWEMWHCQIHGIWSLLFCIFLYTTNRGAAATDSTKLQKNISESLGIRFLAEISSGNWATNSVKKAILYKDRHALKIDMHRLYIDWFPATAVIPDVRRVKLPELPCIGPLDLTCIELLLYVHVIYADLQG